MMTRRSIETPFKEARRGSRLPFCLPPHPSYRNPHNIFRMRPPTHGYRRLPNKLSSAATASLFFVLLHPLWRPRIGPSSFLIPTLLFSLVLSDFAQAAAAVPRANHGRTPVEIDEVIQPSSNATSYFRHSLSLPAATDKVVSLTSGEDSPSDDASQIDRIPAGTLSTSRYFPKPINESSSVDLESSMATVETEAHHELLNLNESNLTTGIDISNGTLDSDAQKPPINYNATNQGINKSLEMVETHSELSSSSIDLDYNISADNNMTDSGVAIDTDSNGLYNGSLSSEGDNDTAVDTFSHSGILLDPGGNEMTSLLTTWSPSGGYFSRVKVQKGPLIDTTDEITPTEKESDEKGILGPGTEFFPRDQEGSEAGTLSTSTDAGDGVHTEGPREFESATERTLESIGPAPEVMGPEPMERGSAEHRAARGSLDVVGEVGERSKVKFGVATFDPSSKKVEVGVARMQGNTSNNSTRKKIAILGLFEMTNKHGERLEGKSEVAAAKLAIQHINDGASDTLIPGYELELLTNDTKCDPGVGVDAFFHALYTRRRGVGVGVGRGKDGGSAKGGKVSTNSNTTVNEGRMVSLLGTACSEVTESLAKVVPYWNILQVSYGSTSPALSDRREFPLFFRTVAPDSSHNPARLAFVRRFKWDTVTALSQNEDVFSLAVNDLVTQLERANVSCRATITFGENDFKVQLRMLRDLDTRIIIGSFSQEVAPKIFCEAYRLGMYGADYAWILQGSPADSWWWENSTTPESHGCPASAIALAVEGLLMVSSHNSIVGDDTPSFSGLTNSMFTRELAAQSLPVTKYAPQAYDAVWAIALALRHGGLLKRAADFDYHQKDLAREFLRALANVHFLGVSGPVSFSGADRVGISAFYQIQGGLVKKVALFYPEKEHLDFECPQCVPPIWQGGQVPIAKRVFKVRVVTIDPVAFMSISCLAILGICLAFAFLGFNLYFRKLKYIKLSSPKLNNMAVIGCILVYMAVILLGLDHATLPEGNFHFAGICTARAYLLSAGFSLAFGSMFTKTYRVHRIFTRSRSGVVKNKMLQDTQLMSLICVLLLMDGLMVTLWVSVDPMQRHLKNLSLEISTVDRSVVYQPQVEVCRSQHTHGWLGALYVYKGLLLVAGLYMAWETRRVQIPALNDSQYIGASVYSVVITSVIVVVLANLISDRATLAFVTITALIFTSTTTTLCLLFVPKIHTIWIHPDGDPIVESMGLKIECNTRRFVIDEKREMYYRVEVQNRVYRRELAALDLDISRLERQLAESPAPSTSTNSLCESPKKVAIVEEESEIHTEESNAEPSNEGETEKSDFHDRGSSQTMHLQVAAPQAPRASWPSADPGPRRHVSFGSQPDLDERRKVSEATSVSAIPLPTSSSSSSSTHAPSSVLRRLLHFAQLTSGDHQGLRFSKTKKGLAGTSAAGAVAAALRHHVKYVANLVPAGSMTATGAPEIVIAGKPSSSSRSGSVVFAEPVISITHNGGMDHNRGDDVIECKYMDGSDDSEEMEVAKVSGIDSGEDEEWEGDGGREADSRSSVPRKFSLSACLSGDDDDQGMRGSPSHEYRQHRKSHGNTRPPPAPSFRERARGSPRFPHKIVPTVACGSMGELRDWRGSNSSGIGGGRVRLKPPSSNAFGVATKLHPRQPNLLMGPELPGKCRSLDASMDLPHHPGVGISVSGVGSGEPNRVLGKGICLRCGGLRPRRSSSGTCTAAGIGGGRTMGGVVKYDRVGDRDGGRSERAKCECLDSSRAASLSPNCDVWCVEQAGDGLQDFIPLSELLVSSSGGGPIELTSAKRTDSQC